MSKPAQGVLTAQVLDAIQVFSRARNVGLGMVQVFTEYPMACQSDVEEFDACMRKAGEHLAAIHAHVSDERNFKKRR